MLSGHDLMLWNICKHFGFKYKLIGLSNGIYDETCVWNGPFRPLREIEEQLGDEYDWPIWSGGFITGMNSTEYDEVENLCPVIQIECPSTEWRDTFLSENIEGNIYEQMLLLHPAFKGYNQWRKQKDYLIGYYLQADYGETDIKRYSITELVERSILKDMDLITVKLCKYFGFEMRKCLRLNPMFEGEILIRNPPRKYPFQMEWRESDWYQAEWHCIYTTTSLGMKMVGFVDRPYEGTMYSVPAEAVIEIKCTAPCLTKSRKSENN